MPSNEMQLEKTLLFLDMGGLSYRKMMGEYLLYLDGTLFGGVYDGRLLLKNTPAGRAILPNAELQLPYLGAKPMIYVDDTISAETAKKAITAICGK